MMPSNSGTQSAAGKIRKNASASRGKSKSARKAMAFRAENILLLEIMALQVQKRTACSHRAAG
jgi:hypothetical protein